MTAERTTEMDAVEALIRAAGAREQPPAGAYERVWPAAEAAWRRGLQRRRRRIGGWMAAAATVAAVAVIISLQSPAGPPAVVAYVDRVAGSLQIRAAGDDAWLPVPAASGQPVVTGSRLRTGGDGRVGLQLPGEVSLRMAGSSELEMSGQGDVRLLQGVVYVDTGPGGGGGRIRLLTEAGTAQDFGTQFEFGYLDGGLRLRVREGQVVIERGAERLVAGAGQQLAVDAAGRIARSDWPRSDPAWRWIESVAPAPPTDGQPVAALLDWAARETGRPLRYAAPAAEQAAARTILHGRLSGLAPLATLDLMLATTGLAYTIGADESIEVRTRAE